VSFGEDLVGVAALLRIHGVESEIVEDQQVDGDDAAELGLVGVEEPGLLEGLEHLVGANGEDGLAAAAGGVTDGVSEEGLADADGADDGDVVVGLEEAQGKELAEELSVEGDLGGLVPALDLLCGIELSFLRAERGGLAVAAGGLVLEDEQQEILVRRLLLSCEGESLGEDVEDARELEALKDGAEVGRDRLGGHACVSPFECVVKGRANCSAGRRKRGSGRARCGRPGDVGGGAVSSSRRKR
jgi:hypothetical protein